MRRISLVLVMLGVATCWIFAQPKVSIVGGSTLDLGDIYNGQKGEHMVTVKNVGKDTLRILDVKAQCGCTAAMVTGKKALAPAEEGQVSISFDTHNYHGKVAKQVYITTNDTTTPKITINFTANVIAVLDISPSFFSFDNSKLDSAYTRTVVITNSTKQSVKILSVKVADDQIKVSLMKNQLMPGEQTELQAVFHPTKPGTNSGDVEVATDNQVQPKVSIKYYTWVNRK